MLASQCQRQWLVSTSKCRLVLSAAPSLRPAHDSRDLQPQAQNCNRNGMGKHCSEWFDDAHYLIPLFMTLDKKLSPLTPWTARRKSWHQKSRDFSTPEITTMNYLVTTFVVFRRPDLLGRKEEPLPGALSSDSSWRSWPEGPEGKKHQKKPRKTQGISWFFHV